jgi:hypothetical protein
MSDLIKYKDEINGDVISYDDAVARVKESDQKYQWILGEIASKLEPKYGENTLERFAEEIGRNYNTLRNYMTTYRAWKDELDRPRFFSVAQELAILPSEKKKEVLQEKPDITFNEARELVHEFKNNELKNNVFKNERLEERFLLPTIDDATFDLMTEIMSFVSRKLKKFDEIINAQDYLSGNTIKNSISAIETTIRFLNERKEKLTSSNPKIRRVV